MGLASAPEGRLAYLLRLLAVVAVYVATGKSGLDLAFASSSATAIWAPTGIALAALVLGGYRLWPAVAVGALLTNIGTGVPAYVVLGITVGNTLEALAGSYLLVRVAGFSPQLDRVRDVIALVGLAALVSTAISATVGTLSLVAAGELGGSDYPEVWRTWWLGDMGGDLLVAPALMVAVTHWPYRLVRERALEALVLALTIGGVGAATFTNETALTYLAFPPLLWAALRLRQVGAVAGGLILGVTAVGLTASGEGPFAMSGPDERLLLAQTFVAVGSATALLLAAITSERRRAEDRAQGIATTLQASLLPRTLPSLPGVESATYFRAAGEGHRVGGDFYDVFEVPGGRWSVVIGDVCGKGAKAAAITALARYTLRNAALEEVQPSRLLGLVHSAVQREHGGDTFCTAVCARFDLQDGQALVTVANGGHPLPLVVRRDGRVAPFGEPGTLLGAHQESWLTDHDEELGPGDSLVLYTDGLTDAYAPERWVGEPELVEVLASSAGLAPAEMINRLRSRLLDDRSREPRDDVAIVVLRLSGRSSQRRRAQ